MNEKFVPKTESLSFLEIKERLPDFEKPEAVKQAEKDFKKAYEDLKETWESLSYVEKMNEIRPFAYQRVLTAALMAKDEVENAYSRWKMNISEAKMVNVSPKEKQKFEEDKKLLKILASSLEKNFVESDEYQFYLRIVNKYKFIQLKNDLKANVSTLLAFYKDIDPDKEMKDRADNAYSNYVSKIKDYQIQYNDFLIENDALAQPLTPLEEVFLLSSDFLQGIEQKFDDLTPAIELIPEDFLNSPVKKEVPKRKEIKT